MLPTRKTLKRLLPRVLAAFVLPAGLLAIAPLTPAAAGTVLAAGTLTTASGTPVGGQAVYLYAWPDDATMASLSAGETAPVQEVGQAVTSSSGAYSISSSTIPAAPTNLSVVTAGAAYFYTSNGTSTVRLANLRLNKNASPELISPTSPTVCNSPTVIKNYGPRGVVLDATYSNVSGVKMGYTYSNGQSSSLGIGFSTNGSTWGTQGTMSRSSTVSETYASQYGPAGTKYHTEFVYKEFRQVCTWGNNYYAEPTSFAGGAWTTSASSPTANYCVWQQKNSVFKEYKSSANTWSGGVSMSGAIGINLSSHTGYSTSSMLKYTFSVGHHLCGTNGYPGEVPKRLVARS